MINQKLTPLKDPTGLLTLKRFAKSDNFNKWLFETIAPLCKGEVLEVGSGIGNITHFFLKSGFAITASDLQSEYLNTLDKRFNGTQGYKGSLQIDLEKLNVPEKFLGSFDTVVASNVIEHIEHPEVAIETCVHLLKPGGRLVILVPAYKKLYNNFDQALGHYTRYNSESIRKLLEANSLLKVTHTQYFNATGILGWWFNGSILGKKIIPENQLYWYNKLVPFFKFLDQTVLNSFGLSVIAMARKK